MMFTSASRTLSYSVTAPVPDAAAVAAAPVGNSGAAPGTGNRGPASTPFAGAGAAVPERGSLPAGCGTPVTWHTGGDLSGHMLRRTPNN